MSHLPAPPYYAVIFVNQRTQQGDEAYGHTAGRMVELAERQNGFLGIESVREDSGKGITVSYWKDTKAIESWKNNVEHLHAQSTGKTDWYEEYQIQVAKVERGYHWIKT